jgi:hypothetical protein
MTDRISAMTDKIGPRAVGRQERIGRRGIPEVALEIFPGERPVLQQHRVDPADILHVRRVPELDDRIVRVLLAGEPVDRPEGHGDGRERLGLDRKIFPVPVLEDPGGDAVEGVVLA